MKFKILLLLGLSTQVFAQKKPKNVIFLIGDGMGLSQISTLVYFKDSASNFETFKHIGFSKTSSTSHKVTDSAAGATAFTTGQKSYNRAIGVSKDTVSLPTILEQLEAKNYKTGLISLCTITHATPASFYAHVKDRDMHEEIAQDLANSNVDFFAGAGYKYFTERKDGQNLFPIMEKKGFIIDTVSLKSNLDTKKRFGFLLDRQDLPAKDKGRGEFLPDATKLALSYLSKNKDGFFLMSEGSYIDWAGHQNNAEMLVMEQLDFDKVVGIALDFAKKDKNTLVIVTADHETGATAIEKGKTADKVQVTFNTDQHTGTMVPVFAYGPGSELFQGIYQNNEIYHKLKALLDF